MFTGNLLFLGHDITIILKKHTFLQNVYVLNNSYVMVSNIFAGCIFWIGLSTVVFSYCTHLTQQKQHHRH